MTSIFNKLFKLQLRSSNKPLEDYLTEIFGFCLNIDIVFRNRFLQLLHLNNKDYTSFFVDTQCVYASDSRRTDLEINLGHTYIIIESKVGSVEGTNQLDAYAEILAEKGQEHKLLVFLTANREEKDKDYPSGITFQQLRWHDVGLCINSDCHPMCQELKEFLRAQKLIMENLKYSDLVTFQAFFKTRKKFNDILRNDVSRLYTKKGLHRYNINQPTIRNNEYVFVFTYGKEVNVALGFGNWWGDHPCLFTRLWISNKKDKAGNKAKEIFHRLQDKNWQFITSNPDGYAVENKVRLIDFLQLEDSQRSEIVDFFKSCIEDLAEIKPGYLGIFNTTEKPLEVVDSEV